MSSVIPLDGGEDNANQSFTAQLGDYYLKFELHYQQSGQWLMNILPVGDTELTTFDINDKTYLCAPVMLEGGCDIIEEYNLTDTLGQLFIVGDEPTLDNLGSSNQLIWYPANEALSF